MVHATLSQALGIPLRQNKKWRIQVSNVLHRPTRPYLPRSTDHLLAKHRLWTPNNGYRYIPLSRHLRILGTFLMPHHCSGRRGLGAELVLRQETANLQTYLVCDGIRWAFDHCRHHMFFAHQACWARLQYRNRGGVNIEDKDGDGRRGRFFGGVGVRRISLGGGMRQSGLESTDVDVEVRPEVVNELLPPIAYRASTCIAWPHQNQNHRYKCVR
jgi:hypothetical protein